MKLMLPTGTMVSSSDKLLLALGLAAILIGTVRRLLSRRSTLCVFAVVALCLPSRISSIESFRKSTTTSFILLIFWNRYVRPSTLWSSPLEERRSASCSSSCWCSLPLVLSCARPSLHSLVPSTEFAFGRTAPRVALLLMRQAATYLFSPCASAHPWWDGRTLITSPALLNFPVLLRILHLENTYAHPWWYVTLLRASPALWLPVLPCCCVCILRAIQALFCILRTQALFAFWEPGPFFHFENTGPFFILRTTALLPYW